MAQKEPLTGSLSRDLSVMEGLLSGTADFVHKNVEVGGVQLCLVMMEGMVNLGLLAQMVARPLLAADFGENAAPEEIGAFILNQTVMAADQKTVKTFDEAFRFAMSGFVVILIDGLKEIGRAHV